MPTRARSRVPRPWTWSLQSAVAVLVVVGLVASVLLAILVDGTLEGPLPGVALESSVLLIVERALALFAAWLIVLVVCAQALQGRLPTEISGRGVRYADAESVQATTGAMERSLRAMRDEIAALEQTVMDLKTDGGGQSE